MKTLKKISAFFVTLLIISSCDNKPDDKDTMEETHTAAPEVAEETEIGEEVFDEMSFLEYVEQKDNLQTFASLLDASGLMDSLEEAESYTLFAPTDQAFDQLGDETLTELMLPEKKNDLIEILEYHIFPGQLSYQDITEGLTVTTMSGEEILINVTETGVVINQDVKALEMDITTEDGLVHIVNQVLFPPDL